MALVQRESPCGLGLYTEQPIQEGAEALKFEGVVMDVATTYSVQVGDGQHIHPHPGSSVDEYHWRYLNHSCTPNCYVDGMALKAARDIKAGEQLTFDYNANEWDMATPFTCGCGQCEGTLVKGYLHLSPEERAKRAKYVSTHLVAMEKALQK